jgi:MFS transporter, YNFM family, putative membrane transport protein
VTIAYINEEWETGAGAAMSAYVTGTVLGGFSGRMIAALVASHGSWRWSFVALGLLNAAGAAVMWAWLPADRHFHRLPSSRAAAAQDMLRHLRNPRLLATCAVGFCVLFTLIATFTYVNFYLAAPPFRLGTRALGLLFTVYLVGIVVTPFAGRSIDRLGHRFALVASFAAGIAGILLTLIESLPAVILGLAILSAGVFITQAAIELHRCGGARRAGVRRGAVHSVLLCGRHAGLGAAGLVLEPRRMARVRGAHRGGAGFDHCRGGGAGGRAHSHSAVWASKRGARTHACSVHTRVNAFRSPRKAC